MFVQLWSAPQTTDAVMLKFIVHTM